ncbi:hypothetical protein SAMN05216575_105141 [Ectopseudomonas alcaliphila]|uniref:Uncharacterized protein n=1 Tax=Ectopseudomonas alcaliphila TaxID=101564 RepID=A0A1G7HNH1_9GAMM|nr:hypothetical protein SAMN05216575_105141 [Pseudomonas alcaliphila]
MTSDFTQQQNVNQIVKASNNALTSFARTG